MKSKETCYCCKSKASTREHVPPLCLFPEAKDLPGTNFRQNLITVPSCDKHNAAKTMDDEFLMMFLAGAVGNNTLAFVHNSTKVKRALERKSPTFINNIFSNPRFLEYTDEKTGRVFPLIAGKPNRERLVKCMKQIGYGLFYHEFGHRFKGEIIAFIGFLNYDDPNTQKIKILGQRKFLFQSKNISPKGSNPDVFTYQFMPPDEFGLIAAKLVFYGNADVYLTYKSKKANPPNFDLTYELIKAGYKVSYDVDGGEPIEFN